MIVQIAYTLLLAAGLFILLGDAAGIKEKFKAIRERKSRNRYISGKPKGKISVTIDQAKEMLTASGMGGQISRYKWAAVILAAIGVVIGSALNNLPVALVLAIGLGASPLVIIRIRTGDYLRSLHEKWESAMSTVTNAYIASGDLIGAVENSLHLFPAPVDTMFKQFYAETQIIDSDVIKALRRLRERIGNRYWRDWIGVLIQCQRDRQMRYALSGIVVRLGEMRRVQMETDTALRKHLGDYIVTVLIVLGAIPLMGAMMPDWYAMLTTTPAGQITLAAVLAAILATAVWVSRLYRPMEGGDRK
jgi:Flp pilus assembly protein TadB